MKNLSQELKRTRDKEARARAVDPAKNIVYSGDGSTGEGGTGYIDIAGLMAQVLTTKGDIVAFSTLPARVGVGTDGQALTADSASIAGVKWANAPAAANGIPAGGTVGQVLSKVDADDYDVEWADPAGGGGAFTDLTDAPASYGAGDAGKVVVVNGTEDGLVFDDAPAATNGVPAGGTIGQVCAKNSNTDYDTEWVDPAAATNGIPIGGTAGQVLVKDTAIDYDVSWGVAENNTIPEAAFTKPTAAGFAASRDGGVAAFADITYGVRLTAPGTTGNTNNLLYLVDTITEGAAGYRATARIRRHTPLDKWGIMGLILRNSADGKSVLFGIGNDTLIGFHRNSYSSDTAWAAVAGVIAYQELDFWIRVHDDLTNRKIYISRYGDFWQQIYTEAHDTYCAPTQVGVFINPNFGDATSANIRANTGMDVYSWLFESLAS